MIHRRPESVLWLVATTVFSFGCDRGIHVSGTVRDRSGAPVEGVTVVLTAEGRAPHPAQSAHDGSYNNGIVGPTRAKLAFSKDGYKSVEVEITSERQELDVTLER